MYYTCSLSCVGSYHYWLSLLFHWEGIKRSHQLLYTPCTLVMWLLQHYCCVWLCIRICFGFFWQDYIAKAVLAMDSVLQTPCVAWCELTGNPCMFVMIRLWSVNSLFYSAWCDMAWWSLLQNAVLHIPFQSFMANPVATSLCLTVCILIS